MLSILAKGSSKWIYFQMRICNQQSSFEDTGRNGNETKWVNS